MSDDLKKLSEKLEKEKQDKIDKQQLWKNSVNELHRDIQNWLSEIPTIKIRIEPSPGSRDNPYVYPPMLQIEMGEHKTGLYPYSQDAVDCIGYIDMAGTMGKKRLKLIAPNIWKLTNADYKTQIQLIQGSLETLYTTSKPALPEIVDLTKDTFQQALLEIFK